MSFRKAFMDCSPSPLSERMEPWEDTWVDAAAPAYPCVRAPPQLNNKVGDVARSSAERLRLSAKRLRHPSASAARHISGFRDGRVLGVKHQDDRPAHTAAPAYPCVRALLQLNRRSPTVGSVISRKASGHTPNE